MKKNLNSKIAKLWARDYELSDNEKEFFLGRFTKIEACFINFNEKSRICNNCNALESPSEEKDINLGVSTHCRDCEWGYYFTPKSWTLFRVKLVVKKLLYIQEQKIRSQYVYDEKRKIFIKKSLEELEKLTKELEEVVFSDISSCEDKITSPPGDPGNYNVW